MSVCQTLEHMYNDWLFCSDLKFKFENVSLYIPVYLRMFLDMFTMFSQFGQTPLHIAAGSGNYEIVKLLVNANGDVNATPKVNINLYYIFCYDYYFIHGFSLPCGRSTRNT